MSGEEIYVSSFVYSETERIKYTEAGNALAKYKDKKRLLYEREKAERLQEYYRKQEIKTKIRHIKNKIVNSDEAFLVMLFFIIEVCYFVQAGKSISFFQRKIDLSSDFILNISKVCGVLGLSCVVLLIIIEAIKYKSILIVIWTAFCSALKAFGIWLLIYFFAYCISFFSLYKTQTEESVAEEVIEENEMDKELEEKSFSSIEEDIGNNYYLWNEYEGKSVVVCVDQAHILSKPTDSTFSYIVPKEYQSVATGRVYIDDQGDILYEVNIGEDKAWINESDICIQEISY